MSASNDTPARTTHQRWLIVWVVLGVAILAVTGVFLMLILSSLREMDASLAKASSATGAAGTNVKPLAVDLGVTRRTLEQLSAALKPAPGETAQVTSSLSAIQTSLESVADSLQTTSSSLSSTSSLLSDSAGSLSSGASTLGAIATTLDQTTNPLRGLSSTLSDTTDPLSEIDDDLSKTENQLAAVGAFVKKVEQSIKNRTKKQPTNRTLVCRIPFFAATPGCE